MLAGVFGTVPNYLCYVNTVLFYRVGGGSRLSGVLLAAATTGVMLIGKSSALFVRALADLRATADRLDVLSIRSLCHRIPS